MQHKTKEALDLIFAHTSYGRVQDEDHESVRKENPLPQQGFPVEVSQGFRLGHRRYHETHGKPMIDEITRLRLDNETSVAEVKGLHARVEELQYDIEHIVGSEDHEFFGAGAAGLSHLLEMYRDKWDLLGPSCRTSLRNAVDNHVKRSVKEARALIQSDMDG